MIAQLYLEDRLVELTEDVQIPLNKTFDDINNPTTIVTDYSKTINIPMTKTNNEIFGYIYKLDRSIVSGDSNIGLYFDPSKKIPFKLMYNSNLIFSGYAKFLNAMYSASNKYYSVALYGSLNDAIKKLKGLVFNPNHLTQDQLEEADGGSKYILDDLLSGGNIDKDMIKKCWRYIPSLSDIYRGGDVDTDIINFIPSYRGYYKGDWDSKKCEYTPPSMSRPVITDVKTMIETFWKNTYRLNHPSASQDEVDKYISELNADALVGDGFTDYQIGSYRSYEQRPCLRISALTQLIKRKCYNLTGYELYLSPEFFNENNPYYTNLYYTLDYLSVEGSTMTNNAIGRTQSKFQTFGAVPDCDYSSVYRTREMTAPIQVLDDKKTVVLTDSFRFASSKVYYEYGNMSAYPVGNLYKSPSTVIAVEMELTTSLNEPIDKRTVWILPNMNQITHSLYGINSAKDVIISGRAGANFAQGNSSSSYWVYSVIADIPKMVFESDTEITGTPILKITSRYQFNPEENQPFIYKSGNSTTYVRINLNSINDIVDTEKVNYQVTWRNNLRMNMTTFFQKNIPPFDIFLQYTKMFGLVWDIDDTTNTIYIKTRNEYFEGYTITDWSDKVDRNKDMSIEPVSFSYRYVDFGYDELAGYNLSSYKTNTGEEYGTKRLDTNYEFNRDHEQLFDGLYPTCCSNRSFYALQDILNWDLTSVIPKMLDPFIRMDCDSDDGKDTEIKSNWIFKLGVNISSDYVTYIDDDSALQIANKEYCASYKLGITSVFPVFSFVYKNSYTNTYKACLMGAPLYDYTSDKWPTKAIGNYIYDNFWSGYINERYNIQNKKVTLYLNINPMEYINFKFNKFITINNQLFMINKIIDYNPSSKETTKCELIQVTDPDVYTNSQII